MRILFTFLISFLSVGFTSTIFGQGTFKPGPTPSWIEKVDFKKQSEDDKSPYRYLLADRQENTILQEDYYHTAIQIYNSEGVQEMSSITVDYDPSYQSVIFHDIFIHRDGEVQSRAANDFKILQRETDLQRALYDGFLTAVKELKDIRKGDIIEFAYSITGYNPIYGDDRYSSFLQNFGVPVDRLYQSIISDREMNLKYSNNAIEATLLKENNKWVYIWDLRDIAPLYEDYTVPSWIEQYKTVTLSTMQNWEEVVTWANKLYHLSKADKKKLRSKLKSQLSLEGSDQDILDAIRFVQDEIRYLGFENGISAFKPHKPLDVLNQRFGDCKDKSFLLSSILREMGIDASPMLVHSFKGFELDERLPSPHAFDHCIVQFERNSVTYVVDPTMANQGGDLDNLSVPAYREGLPIKDEFTGFLKFKNQVAPQIIVNEELNLDSVNGGATYDISTTYNGIQADYQRSYFSSSSRSDIKQAYKEYYQSAYPSIQAVSLEIIDDSRDGKNSVEIKESYHVPSIWEEDEYNFNLNIYSQALADYLYLKPHEKDTMPYFLGDRIEYIQTVKVNLPEDWHIEYSHNEINNDYFDYRYSVNYEDRQLVLKHRYYLKNEIVKPDKVSKVLTDADNVLDLLNYQLNYNKALLGLQSNDGIAWQFWLNWFLCLVIGGFLGRWMIYKYDPQPSNLTPPLELGGWILLPAFGLIITPLVMLVQFFQLWNEGSYNASTWVNVASEFGFGGLLFIYIESILNVTLLLWTIILIILLFKKRSNFPKLITYYYIFSFLLMIGDSFIASLFIPEEPIWNRDVTRSLIVAAIWIPYFHYSDRVKNTFTVMLNPPPKVMADEEE